MEIIVYLKIEKLQKSAIKELFLATLSHYSQSISNSNRILETTIKITYQRTQQFFLEKVKG